MLNRTVAVQLATELWFDCPFDVIEHYVEPFMHMEYLTSYLPCEERSRIVRCGSTVVEFGHNRIYATSSLTGTITVIGNVDVRRVPAEQLAKYIPANILAEAGTDIYTTHCVSEHSLSIKNRTQLIYWYAWLCNDRLVFERHLDGVTDVTYNVSGCSTMITEEIDPMFVVDGHKYLLPL